MNEFEKSLNDLLVDTFYSILKYEELSLKTIFDKPITISEVHMIDAVSKHEKDEATVGKIATYLDFAPPTVTIAIKKLEKKGLVKKTQCIRDARRTIITLTEQGRKIDRLHGLFHAKMVRNISDLFIDSEKDILLRAIEKLSEFFRDKVEA